MVAADTAPAIVVTNAVGLYLISGQKKLEVVSVNDATSFYASHCQESTGKSADVDLPVIPII